MGINDEGRRALDDERILPTDGEDPAREGLMNDLLTEPSRPLSDEEEEAAEHDAGRRPRVYAPESARVPKEPAPGDDKLIEDRP